MGGLGRSWVKGLLLPRPRVICIESLACLGLALLSAFFHPAAFGMLDNLFHDGLVRVNAHGPIPEKVVITDIDDESLAKIGQWPWPRYLVGQLLRNLAEGSPDATGVDIFFPEPDRSSLTTIRDSFQREFGLHLEFSGIPKGMEDNDAFLGAVLASTKAAVPVFDLFDRPGGAQSCSPPPLTIASGGDLIRPLEAQDTLCNLPAIQNGLSASGFINVNLDADGSTRHLSLIHRVHDRYYPSLPLAVFMLAEGVKAVSIADSFLGPVLVVGKARIPISRTGDVRIRFDASAGAHRNLAADDVLRRRVEKDSLKGKIVILGSSAPGLNDLHLTAISPNFPGLEIYAALLDDFFENAFYREPVFSGAYQVWTTILAVLVLGAFFLRCSPVKAMLGAATLVLVFPVIGAIAFFAGGLILPVACPALTAGVQFAVLSASLYALEQRLAIRNLNRLVRARQLTLESMTAVAEGHDELGGAHIKRTQNYVGILAKELQAAGRYPILTDRYIELLFHSSPLHDIGKVGIPDRILFKPGPLTPEEFAVMKEHVPRGRRIIESILRNNTEDHFLEVAAEIAAAHHEKWDGSGYPQGLKGEAIPLSGRIMALADVYDALTTVRHYKPAFPHEKARAIIVADRGAHFDPAVVDAFLSREEDFQRIRQELTDAAASVTAYDPAFI